MRTTNEIERILADCERRKAKDEARLAVLTARAAILDARAKRAARAAADVHDKVHGFREEIAGCNGWLLNRDARLAEAVDHDTNRNA